LVSPLIYRFQVDERSKHDPKILKCIFAGYAEIKKKKFVRLSDPVSGKINISRDVIFHEYEQDLSSSIARSTDFSDFNCANDASVPSGGDGVSVNELSYVELPRKQRHPLHTLINRQVHYLLLV
jgi:hypothetical protein